MIHRELGFCASNACPELPRRVPRGEASRALLICTLCLLPIAAHAEWDTQTLLNNYEQVHQPKNSLSQASFRQLKTV
jgi:hypothetical protein